MPPESASPIHEGTPYFMGDHALVKFASSEAGFGPETYWLVDKKSHILRPFESHTALQNAFGDGLDQAIQHLVTIHPPKVDDSGEIIEGVLKDYNILSPDYAIKEDGSAKKLHFSPHQLRTRYGKPINDQAEQHAALLVEGLLKQLQSDPKGGVDAAFVHHIKKDTHLMAFYISAIAYGGYHIGDVHTDIFRRFKRGEGPK